MNILSVIYNDQCIYDINIPQNQEVLITHVIINILSISLTGWDFYPFPKLHNKSL